MALYCGSFYPNFVAIHTFLKLPYNAHTIYLGPFINQLHLNKQLYIRNFRFFMACF